MKFKIASIGKTENITTSRNVPIMMKNIWGTVKIKIQDNSYIIVGDSARASGINFDGKNIPLNGENIISFNVQADSKTKWIWGDGSKAFKVEINGIACQLISPNDLADCDSGDPYCIARNGIISFIIPSHVTAINKLQIVIGQGEDIALKIDQPILSSSKQANASIEKTHVESEPPLNIGGKDIDVSQIHKGLVNKWGVPQLFTTNLDGGVLIKGDNVEASGLNFDNKAIPISPDSELRLRITINKGTWDWGSAIKIEANDLPLIPSRFMKEGSEEDPYLKPFTGTKEISYNLGKIGETLRKLQVVVGKGSNLDIEIHNIKIED